MRRTIVAIVLLIAIQAAAATPEQSPRQIIPAAAHVAGLDGSVWRTEVVVYNPTDETAQVRMGLILENEPYGLTPYIGFSVEVRETVVIHDPWQVIPWASEEPSGALFFESTSDSGAPLPIVVTSRTYNDGHDGTFGQGIPAVAWRQDGDLDDPERRIVGLESSTDFRSNLGIVNVTSRVEETFSIEILDASGEVAATDYLRLAPGARIQINDILAKFGLAGSGFTAVVTLTRWEDQWVGVSQLVESGPHPDFIVYGSKIDRRSNDPTYLEAQTETAQSGLPKHRVIPAAAKTGGNDGAEWQTDVTIHAVGDGGVAALIVELVPTGGIGIGSGSPDRMVTTIRGGETKDLEDIIGEEFPEHEVAALVVQGLAGGAGNTDVRVLSRTWTATEGDEGTMGQGIPGAPRRSVAEPVVIPGLEESDRFRSNVGLVNLSRNIRKKLSVEVFKPDGTGSRGVKWLMEPWSHIQLNSILSDMGFEGAGFTAVVTLTEFENLMLAPSESWEPIFMAYGSKIDSATNDPTYIDGVRLSPEPAAGQGDWVDFSTDEPWYRCPDDDIPEEATVVRAFDRDLHWFGSENHRSIAREVDFPETDDWNQVGLRLELECPENGLCDHWDRTGSLQLVLNPDDPEDEWEYLEIMRHITPYRVGMCQYVDITPLAPMLVGRQTLCRGSTPGSGPGHSDGEGWRITWDFVFYPGVDRTPDEVVNIWGRRSIEVGNLDPDRTVDAQTEPVDIVIPEDASRVEARLITTGHAFGNALNCAEFCAMRQDLWLDGQRRSVLPWRTDCEHNPVTGQQGTWRYDRNGWCPGAITIGQTIDVTDLVVPGETSVLDFDIRLQDGTEYENTNPGGGLTPIEWVSLQLYIYRD